MYKKLIIDGKKYIAESTDEPTATTITDDDGTWEIKGEIHEPPPMPLHPIQYRKTA